MTELTILLIGCWAGVSVKAKSLAGIFYLALATLILIIMATLIEIYACYKDCDVTYLHIAFILSAIGMMLQYSYNSPRAVLTEVIIEMAGLLLGVIFGLTGLYRKRLIGLLCFLGIPLALILTRILGKEVNGSYLSIYKESVITLGCLMLMAPIAAGYCLSRDVELTNRKRPWKKLGEGSLKRVDALPLNHYLLLGLILIVAFLAGVINNEYGTVIVISGMNAIMFLLYGRNMQSKIRFSLAGLAGIIAVLGTSVKVRNRLLIFINIQKAMEQIPWDAAPVLYLQENIHHIGLYGAGNGALEQDIIQNVTTDYAIAGILYGNGLIFTILAITLIVLLIKNVWNSNVSTKYERIVVDSIGLILFIMTLFAVSGVLGSFLLSGIGVPFLSQGKSTNMAMYVLMGLLIVIRGKGESMHA